MDIYLLIHPLKRHLFFTNQFLTTLNLYYVLGVEQTYPLWRVELDLEMKNVIIWFTFQRKNEWMPIGKASWIF